MKLIVVSGLPCTGKSTIAEKLSREFHIPVFTKDWFETTLRRIVLGEEAKVDSGKIISEDGYKFMTMLAMRQLVLGQSAILEGVIPKEALRQEWRKLAQKYNAGWYVIECVCSDELMHKQRLCNRKRNIPNWHEVTWERVELFKSLFEKWEEDRLILDSVDPLESNINKALTYVSNETQKTLR